MYVLNTMAHGKCFVQYVQTHCSHLFAAHSISDMSKTCVEMPYAWSFLCVLINFRVQLVQYWWRINFGQLTKRNRHFYPPGNLNPKGFVVATLSLHLKVCCALAILFVENVLSPQSQSPDQLAISYRHQT